MSRTVLKGIGIGCFLMCPAMLLVAWERQRSYVERVKAFNAMMDSPLFGEQFKQFAPLKKVEPGVSEEAVGASAIAGLLGVSGFASMTMARKKSQSLDLKETRASRSDS